MQEVKKEEMRRVVHLRSYIKFILAAVLCAGGVVLADWDVGDPALYYQLPDFDGWSVYGDGGGAEPVMAADDWTAATTTTITDIYFWGSWKGDVVGDTGNILIQIFNNDASLGFPTPDECVWSRIINQGQYMARIYQEDLQNYYDPRQADKWLTDDDVKLYQYSIPLIDSPFIQEAGLTYWLMISMAVEGGDWGWSTAGSISGGSAVFRDINGGWTELMTPVGYQDPRIPMDMAFVLVTPEPTTLLLLGLGAVMVRRKHG
jgi:hypothetical protein